MLATVLFTDIVNSTARAATLGDHRWRTLLDEEMPGCGYAVQFVFAAVIEVDAGSGDEVDDGARTSTSPGTRAAKFHS